MLFNYVLKRFKFVLLMGLAVATPEVACVSWLDSVSRLPDKVHKAWNVYKRYKDGVASEQEIEKVNRAKNIARGVAVVAAASAGVWCCVHAIRQGAKNGDELLWQKDNITIHRAAKQAPNCCGASALINVARMLQGERINQPYGEKVDAIYDHCGVAKGIWLTNDQIRDVIEKDDLFKELDIRVFGGWDFDRLSTPPDQPEIGEWVILKLKEDKPAGFLVHVYSNHWVAVVVKHDDTETVQFHIADSMNWIKSSRLPNTIEQLIKIVSIAQDEI